MKSLIPMIFGMAAVTYIPRLIPFLFLGNRKIPQRLDKVLKCIPLAALGALIVPGAFQSTPDFPLAGIVGMAFTLIYGLFRGGIIVPVLGSVAVTCFVLFGAG
jgi:branched-subunit amino acid transport protein